MMQTKRIRREWLPLAILCAFAWTGLVGCGGGLKRVPVSGTVTLDGGPLEGGILTFCPDTAKGNTYQISCTSPVRGGRYELQTIDVTGRDSGEGAPPGWYKVILKTPNLSTKKNPRGPVNVNDKYKSVEKTPLSAEVKENPEPGAYDFKMTR